MKQPTTIKEVGTIEELAPLSDLGIGERGVIDCLAGADSQLCSKLATMGMVSGTTIQVIAVAPLGDPIKVDALGYRLSLRKSEAESIRVKLL